MRENGTLYYLLGDHLGSTSITANADGGKQAELRYKAYGESRYAWGDTPTSFRFTGQREDDTIGLYFYNARYYDPLLGRFIQADTIVPNPAEPQDLNRYSYVRNNPLRYIDPSGHGIQEWFEDKIKDFTEATTSRPIIRDYDRQILQVARARNIDPVILATIIFHESQAQERVLFGDLGERLEVELGKDSDYASIGVGQMQLRRAKELEAAGYIEPRVSRSDRVSALLNVETAIDYTGALLQSNFDQLDAWAAEHSVKFSNEARTKLGVLSYNWGWEEVQERLNENAYDITALNDKTWSLINEPLYIHEALSSRNVGAVEGMLGVCSSYHKQPEWDWD